MRWRIKLEEVFCIQKKTEAKRYLDRNALNLVQTTTTKDLTVKEREKKNYS